MAESFENLKHRTLEELEGDAWVSPEFRSYVVMTAHTARKKPIGELSVEELRLLIGQEIGLPWVVPLALGALLENPLAEGDLYPGDLLKSVLNVPQDYWRAHPDQRSDLARVLQALHSLPSLLEDPELLRELSGLARSLRAGERPDR